MHMQAEGKKHAEAAPAAKRVQEIQLKIFETLRGMELKEGEETAAIHAIGHLLATLIVQHGGDEVTARERMAGWVRSTMIALELPVEKDEVLKMPPEIAELVRRWRGLLAELTEGSKESAEVDSHQAHDAKVQADAVELCIDELIEAYGQPVQPESSIIIMPG